MVFKNIISKLVKRTCTKCGREYYSYALNRIKFCSNICYFKSKIGSKQTRTHVKNRIESRKKNGYWKNPEEHFIKQSLAMKGKMSGSKSPFYGRRLFGSDNSAWKGGVSKDKTHIRNLQRIYDYNRRDIYKTRRELKVETIQRIYEENIKKYSCLTCYLCLEPIKFGDDSIDHKHPLSRGGGNNKENLEVTHRKCNHRKLAKTESEYREYLKTL